MRVVLALAGTIGSAVAYGLCFPPVELRSLAWVVLVPFFVAIRRAGSLGAGLLAWLWTVVAAYAVGDWFPWSVSTYYQQPIAVGIAFFAGVSSIMGAPYFIAFAACYRAMARTPAAVRPLLVAAAWTGADWSRANLASGNPWALFGYSQSGVGPLIQIVEVTGVYGLSFVLAAMNAAVAEGWMAFRVEGPRARRHSAAGLGLATMVLAFVLSYGFVRLDAAPPIDAPVAGTRVAIVQGNLDLGSQWRQEFYGRNLDVYMQLSVEALRAERPAVVYWPESAMTFFLEEENLHRGALGRMLEPFDAELVAGAPRVTGSRAAPSYHNTAFLISPAGTIVASYDKQRLLPFAEYFPVRRLDFLRRRFARVREFTPGPSTDLLPTAAGRAGVVICNEAVFPDIPSARVRDGATYLVNLANDTWVSDPKFSAQLFDIVSLRAVEQRRYLVRASTAGFSAIVDPWGRTLAMAEPFARSWIAGEVGTADSLTPYCRFGDLFAYGCIGVAGAVVLRRWLMPAA
jgi:apolipoprotein N-acyltransferase